MQWRTDFALLVRNLLRRVSLAARAHGQADDIWFDAPGLLARAATVTAFGEYLRWWDHGRYSTRQQTALKLGGFVGGTGFRGAALPEFLPLLAAGELLGVGSATTFGLGQYRVRNAASTPDFTEDSAAASDNSRDLRAMV